MIYHHQWSLQNFDLKCRLENWLVFITKHVNANVVFCFNFAKILFSNGKPNSIIIKILNKFFIVELILEFNQLNRAEKGLKILTPNQMLSRLPISLAQLKAGNNSEKLKNEIRQLLYSLYRSKKPTKIYP